MVALGNVGLHLALALSWMLLLEQAFGSLTSFKVKAPISDRVADRADGGREGALQDVPALPADVLAAGPQGAYLHQRPRRADEHGGAVAPEDRLRARRRRLSVRWQLIPKNARGCVINNLAKIAGTARGARASTARRTRASSR